MAKSKRIPKTVQNEVLEIVKDFNKKHKTTFRMTFRGAYAYLAKTEKLNNDFQITIYQMMAKKLGISINDMNIPRGERVVETKLGRLKYNGEMNNWDFAVFKYSREKYDPDEFLFPGAGNLDGTIEGALWAGIEVYP